MKWDRTGIHAGMRARSTTGEELGTVVRMDDDTFIVEKGGPDPHAYELRYRYVADIRGDEIIYAVTDTAPERAPAEATAERREGLFSRGAAATAGAAGAAVAATGRAGTSVGDKLSAVAASAREKLGLEGRGRERASEALKGDGEEELRMTFMDEEMAIEKVARETGHVRIRKEVRIEEKHVTVPVMVEEVVIERVPVGREAGSDVDLSFKGQEVDLTVHEEEVRVVKRPVVREELRIRKIAHSEERDASATLRHEDVRVDDSAHPGPYAFHTADGGSTERH